MNRHFFVNCFQIFSLEMMKAKPKIFGILNLTPDSFSDGGKFNETQKALSQAELLLNSGADFVDIGGESTRPGAKDLEWEEEWARVKNFLEEFGRGQIVSVPSGLEKIRSCPYKKISLDSRKPEVARKFCELGGQWLNDVSGFQDEAMVDVALEFDTFCIVNHFPGKNITEVHEQKISSIMKVMDDLMFKRESLIEAGVDEHKIILDPGIGFGKTMECNWELLKFPELVPDIRVMIGHSRKRFLGENRMDKAVNDAAAQIAIDADAWALRVHDI